MNYWDLLLIACALSLDAFAASITCGIKLKTFEWKKYVKISSSFAFFQFLMPLLGYLLGLLFLAKYLAPFSKWIQAGVFFFLSIKAFKEAYEMYKSSNECTRCTCDNALCLLGLSVATSIDALLIGLVLSLFPTSIFTSVSVIGMITFSFCIGGCLLGFSSNAILKKWSPVLAAALLLGLALKSVFIN